MLQGTINKIFGDHRIPPPSLNLKLIDVGIVWRQTAKVTDAEINLDEIYIDLK